MSNFDKITIFPQTIAINSKSLIARRHGRRPRGDGEMCPPPPPGSEFRGEVPPEIAIFLKKNLNIYHFLDFQYFRNKVFEIRGEIGIRGVGVFDSPESISPVGIRPSQSKLRGDAPVRRN